MVETTLSGATHHILTNDYASEWMGIEVLKIDDGHATIRMHLRQEMLNGFGMAHGGMIFAFADTAFALACNPANPTPKQAANITVASGVDIGMNVSGIGHSSSKLPSRANRLSQGTLLRSRSDEISSVSSGRSKISSVSVSFCSYGWMPGVAASLSRRVTLRNWTLRTPSSPIVMRAV